MQGKYRKEIIERLANEAENMCRWMYSGHLENWPGLDMTVPQIKTMVILEQLGPMRMGTVSRYLGGTFSATTSTVDRLVRQELVERVSDEHDRRVVVCQLTHKGREKLEQFWRLGRQRIIGLLDQMEDKHLEVIVRAMALFHKSGLDNRITPRSTKH